VPGHDVRRLRPEQGRRQHRLPLSRPRPSSRHGACGAGSAHEISRAARWAATGLRIGSRSPGWSAVRCSAMSLRRLACGDISALRSRARAGLMRSSRCASSEGSSRAQRSPRRQSLRKILPPTSRHQTVGGFYYILFVARPLCSSYQGIIHFYSSKLADASQFTSLGAYL
jgi:hypothetical protein